MSAAILFDGERVQELDDLAQRPRRLRGSKLLWVDVDRSSPESAARVAQAFVLDHQTRDRLESSSGRDAVFRDHGHYIHITAYAPQADDGGEVTAVECVVGENWVVTAHDALVPVLEDFAERAAGSGETGALDGPSFLAALLDWVLGAYSDDFERIEERLEQLDIQAMRGHGDAERDIERLVGMRQEVGRLQRALASHRSALVALTHPELDALGDDSSRERFEALLGRFDSTMQAARDAREAIVGSFDVLLARTGQRTNEIVKVLTLASVIFLPGALLAGVMGMNFKVGLFDASWGFYVVVAVVIAVAPVAVALAKLRDWI
jgi:magnesium transporter